jgi:endonuclease I
MKKFLTYIFYFALVSIFAQVQAYYNDVDLTKTGMQLKDELAVKIINTHYTQLSYSDLWNVLQQTDECPTDNTKVLLIYGWENGQDNDCHNDRMRDKNDNGGSASNCEWNREHVYPRSLGTPDLGSTGAGSDAHHVRPSDVSMNSWRGNKKFAGGSGNAGTVNSNFWYPGDEWKGDVARIIMYLYLRYGSQCLPSNVGTGASVASDPDMLQLFLQWNADDPPSAVEDQRNNLLETIQGNRNPFIDNPYLATVIWGGPVAQDRWNMSVSNETLAGNVIIHPNPATEKVEIRYENGKADFKLISIDGKIIRETLDDYQTEWNIEALPDEIYFIFVKTRSGNQTVKKLIKQ